MGLFKKFLKTISILIVSYFVLMTLIMIPSNSLTRTNASESLELIQTEGTYPEILDTSSKTGTRIDNFTDGWMVSATVKKQSNPIVAAMSINHYERYWQGYLIFLRPLMAFFNLSSIRYFSLFISMILFALTFYVIAKSINLVIALFYAVAMTSISFFIIPMCLEYSSLLYILNLSVLYILVKRKLPNTLLIFCVIGSLVNFFDFLTYPVITLGIPLALLLIKKHYQDNGSSFQENIKTTSLAVLGWFSSYSITWLAKWCLATLILQKNVIVDAVNQVLLRSEGTSSEAISSNNPVLHRPFMLKENVLQIFTKQFILIFIIILIALIILAVINKISFSTMISLSPMIFVAVLPYIWYLVLGNHSQVHYWMTYRAQAVFVFTSLSYAYLCINNKRNSEKLKQF
ncbi:hypothetical protein [Paucilactobacillus nenjiangensis]|uniref:hypothetical protein n=1 Tax=Paucilactobacillus nenjiangensis TaxID=1296540 RepID=UPI0010F9517C|nr:hypothetical protein [Paucilactobacillus nenjiangensis]